MFLISSDGSMGIWQRPMMSRLKGIRRAGLRQIKRGWKGYGPELRLKGRGLIRVFSRATKKKHLHSSRIMQCKELGRGGGFVYI